MLKLHSECLKTKTKQNIKKNLLHAFFWTKKNTGQIAVESGFLSEGPHLFLSRCTKSNRNIVLNQKRDKKICKH